MKTCKLSESTLMERIRLFYVDGRALSEEDTKIKNRLEAAHSLILDEFETDRNAVAILTKRFGISASQAYSDLTDAKNLFGNIRAANKDGLRYLVTQWAIGLFRMGKMNNDPKTMASALDLLIKANNLDKHDLDIPDASKIQPPVQLLSVNFSFINSPMFQLIDETAQKAMLKQYDEFMLQVKISPMADYLDVWTINDSVRANKK